MRYRDDLLPVQMSLALAEDLRGACCCRGGQTPSLYALQRHTAKQSRCAPTDRQPSSTNPQRKCKQSAAKQWPGDSVTGRAIGQGKGQVGVFISSGCLGKWGFRRIKYPCRRCPCRLAVCPPVSLTSRQSPSLSLTGHPAQGGDRSKLFRPHATKPPGPPTDRPTDPPLPYDPPKPPQNPLVFCQVGAN